MKGHRGRSRLRNLVVRLAVAVAAAGVAAPSAAAGPLVPGDRKPVLPAAWQNPRVGDRDFHVASQHWLVYRPDGELTAALAATGLSGRITASFADWRWFSDAHLKSPVIRAGRERFERWHRAHRWPWFTIMSSWGPMWKDGSWEDAPRREVLARIQEVAGDTWLGDGHAEEDAVSMARLMAEDPRLPESERKLRTEQIGRLGFPDSWKLSFPELRPGRRWTRERLTAFSEQAHLWHHAAADGHAIGGGYIFSRHMQARLPRTRSLVAKMAWFDMPWREIETRGAARQFRRYWWVWADYGPLAENGFFETRRMAPNTWPLSYVKRRLYQVYYSGAGQILWEKTPEALVGPDGKGGYALTPPGRVWDAFLRHVETFPDRGVAYTPVMLLTDWDAPNPYFSGRLWYKLGLPYQAADHMEKGLVRDLLYPRNPLWERVTLPIRSPREVEHETPWGALLDLFRVSRNGAELAPAVLAGYRVVVLTGALDATDPGLWSRLVPWVRAGGTLVVTEAQAGPASSPLPLGLVRTAGSGTATVALESSGSGRFQSTGFRYRKVEPRGARVLLRTEDGDPLVTVHDHGAGRVVYVAVPDLLEQASVPAPGHRRKRPLVPFAGWLMDLLAGDLFPFRLERPHPHYWYRVTRRSDGWNLLLMDTRPGSTAVVPGRQPPKPATVRISSDTAWSRIRDITGDASRTLPIPAGEVLPVTLEAGALRVLAFDDP